MDKASKYLQVLRQKHLDAEQRLNKARALYLSAPTDFDPVERGRNLWEDYNEAWQNFVHLSELLEDQGIEPAVDPHQVKPAE